MAGTDKTLHTGAGPLPPQFINDAQGALLFFVVVII
jgi:hypothetical protein